MVHTQAVAIGARRGGASGGGAEDETRGVLHYLLQSACAPFFEILGCWIYEGNTPQSSPHSPPCVPPHNLSNLSNNHDRLFVLSGRVDDPYDEFFIEERSLEGTSTAIDGMDIYDEEYCKTPAPARSLAATSV